MKSSSAIPNLPPAAAARRLAVLVLLIGVLLPRDASAFQTPSPKQRRSNVISSDHKVINDINSNSHQLFLEPRKLSSCSTSQLFGKQNNEEESEGSSTQDVNISDDTNDDDNKNKFTTKVWPTLKIALPSFLVGGIATLCFLFLPLMSDYYDAFSGDNVYGGDSTSKTASSDGGGNGGGNKANINNVNQPVILFETILNDLNDAYVDDVDIQKLFETGVKAMTASLDPYTEFESRSEAAELEESVTGRYGGVGLVIRGGTNLADASDDIALEPIDATPPSSSSSTGSSGNKKQTKDASKPPVAVKDAYDDEEDLDLVERKRARQKTMEEGVRVVSAFEGYAYDAGMRVGDKLLAVDDFEIKPNTAVDEVRNHLRGEPGTEVQIKFLREGVGGKVNEPQTITLKRAVVHIPDVKYFGFVGDPRDGIGYIDLSGFANDAGREVRFAIKALQHGAELLAMRDGEIKTDNDGAFIHDPTKLKVSIGDTKLVIMNDTTYSFTDILSSCFKLYLHRRAWFLTFVAIRVVS